MDEVDFNTLFVLLAHFLDALLVSVLLALIHVSPQEVTELFSDKRYDFWFLDPGRQILLLVRVVINAAQILLSLLTIILQKLSLEAHRHIC